MADRGYMMVVGELGEEEGGGFLAYAPDLQGCVADGETAEAAIADLRSAIEESIDEAKRLHREVPPPGKTAERARQERDKLHSVLEAQQELLKKQDELIATQRADLEKIAAQRAVLERFERTFALLFESEHETERLGATWDEWLARPSLAGGPLPRRKGSIAAN